MGIRGAKVGLGVAKSQDTPQVSDSGGYAANGGEPMAKQKSAETPSHGRQRAAQETLPGMATTQLERKPPAPLAAARRRGRIIAPEAQLHVAPTNGAGQPPHAHQQPAATSAPPASPATPAKPAAPKRPRQSSSRRFGDLREALADGWEIVQPIFARPLWSAADDSQTAFNFVLRRDQATRLLTVPGSRTVERFITTHNLKVDYRR